LLLASTSTPTLGLVVQAEISNTIIAHRKNLDMTLTHFIVTNSTNLSGWRNIYRVFKIKRLAFSFPPQIANKFADDAGFDFYLAGGVFMKLGATDVYLLPLMFF